MVQADAGSYDGEDTTAFTSAVSAMKTANENAMNRCIVGRSILNAAPSATQTALRNRSGAVDLRLHLRPERHHCQHNHIRRRRRLHHLDCGGPAQSTGSVAGFVNSVVGCVKWFLLPIASSQLVVE